MKELRLLEEIKKIVKKPGDGVKVGIGDDCAVLEYSREKYLLWASDMLVEGTHFNVKRDGYRRIGHKAVAVNISDIAAMGGLPKYVTVSVGSRPGTGTGEIRALYKGIQCICGEYGVSVIGGDLNRSYKLVIDISIMGFVEKKRLVTRRGAKDGDMLLVTGPVRDGRKRHLDFEPRLKEGRHLSGGYKISSMIDVSDGIAPDLARICEASKVGCRLYMEKVPLSKGLKIEDALHYGESFELLFTASRNETAKIMEDAESGGRGGAKFFLIGEILPASKGLKLVKKDGSSGAIRMRAFEHFR